MENIIIEQSGILQALGCSVDEIKKSYALYRKGFIADSMRNVDYSDIQDFIKMLLHIGNLETANALLEKHAVKADEYRLEIQIKKSAGTFDGWMIQIEAENKAHKPFMDAFFDELSRRLPPIKLPNSFN